MGKTAAIFDVDGTLIRGGTERQFFLYLCRKGFLKPPELLDFLIQLVRCPRERFRNKRYLRGLAVSETIRLGRLCYQKLIAPRLRPRALACIKTHQAQGRMVVLITGSLDFLIQPLVEEVGADRLIATELSQCDGRFTGELKRLHPRGENKRRLLEEMAAEESVDLGASYAYGDHLEDIPLLQAVGYPVAANPSRCLKRLARQWGWPIEYF